MAVQLETLILSSRSPTLLTGKKVLLMRGRPAGAVASGAMGVAAAPESATSRGYAVTEGHVRGHELVRSSGYRGGGCWVRGWEEGRGLRGREGRGGEE